MTLCLSLEFAERFGGRFRLSVKGADASLHYIIHIPTLLRICESVGLQMISISNFLDFHREHKYAFRESLKSMNIPSDLVGGRVPEADLLSLYATFIFEKNASVPDVLQSSTLLTSS